MNSVDVNSPPLSDRTTLMCLPISFSIITLNFLNTLNFSFKKYAHVFHEKSSTKEIKYLLPLKDSGVIAPHTLIWIRPSCSFAWYLEFLRMKSSTICWVHILHTIYFRTPGLVVHALYLSSPAPSIHQNVSDQTESATSLSNPGHQVSNTSLVWSLSPTYTYDFSSSLRGQSNVQVCHSSLVLSLSLKSSNHFPLTISCSKCYFWDQVHSTHLEFPQLNHPSTSTRLFLNLLPQPLNHLQKTHL